MQTNYWDLKEDHGNKVVNMRIKFSAEAVSKLPLNLLSSNGEVDVANYGKEGSIQMLPKL